MNRKKIQIDQNEVSCQKEAVMWHLQEHGKITSWEAIKYYGITRLAQCIYLLRGEGYPITSERVEVETRFTKMNGEARKSSIAVYHYIEPKGELVQGTLNFS